MISNNEPSTRLAKRCDLSLNGLEQLFDSHAESEQSALLPELAKVVVGILAWPIAKLSYHKKERYTGHVVRRFVQEGNLTAAIEYIVTPDPRLGMPTMLTLRLLFALLHLGYELKEKLGYVPEFIPVGSWNQVCELVGLVPDRKHRALMKLHLDILHSTLINSRKAFKVSRKTEGISDKFILIPSIKYKGELDGSGVQYDQTYVAFSKPLRESIENNYVKTIDLAFMSQLKTDIAQLLYTKLSYLFQESSKQGKDCVEVTYQWLAETMGITVFTDRWLAMRQLRHAFEELNNQQYITKSEWDEWRIRIWPGVRFILGEKAQLKARQNALAGKEYFWREQQVMIPNTVSSVEGNNDKQTILTIQAARIISGREPDVTKLNAHGWTLDDAKHKAIELREAK